VEHITFKPLVFSATAGMGHEATYLLEVKWQRNGTNLMHLYRVGSDVNYLFYGARSKSSQRFCMHKVCSSSVRYLFSFNVIVWLSGQDYLDML